VLRANRICSSLESPTFADMRLDETSVSTGLLHGVVEEDTLVDRLFADWPGDEITRLVDGKQSRAHPAISRKKKQQAENVRKMVLAMITRRSRRADQPTVCTIYRTMQF